MAFIRNIENFICEHCGAEVEGSGYTNHCPHCLWSKHVDMEPGDRAATCGGLMKPVRIEGASPEYDIVQVCEKCKHERRNKVAHNDSEETILAVVRASMDA